MIDKWQITKYGLAASRANEDNRWEVPWTGERRVLCLWIDVPGYLHTVTPAVTITRKDTFKTKRSKSIHIF